MDANAYVGEVISGFVFLFVGVRLYRLSRRTGQLPDTLIAASFLLWTLSYAIWDIPYTFVESADLVPAAYSYGSLIALASGNVVFRSSSARCFGAMRAGRSGWWSRSPSVTFRAS